MKLRLSPMPLGVALVIGLACAGPVARAAAPVLEPDKLLVLSTTDVRGETGPCGCHIPKGGLSRRASYVDSLRAIYGQVMLVDAGNFTSDDDKRRDAAPFLMAAMRALGTDAVNVGALDLRFGLAYLAQNARKFGLPLVSANLLDGTTRKPVFEPYVLKQVGSVKVGVFGLIAGSAALGPAKDSLVIDDPQKTAARTVAELRDKGAQVIVLLSQMGKIDGEDLVTSVGGIDAVVLGGYVPLIERGRMVGKTIACYGGDQGHYVCRTEIDLDAARHMASGQATAVILGPEVADKPAMAAMVKAFEDALGQRIDPGPRPPAKPDDKPVQEGSKPRGG